MELPFYDDVHAAGGEIYLVGGSVRDALSGRPIKDADLVIRGIPAERLEELLARHGRVEAAGRSFAVFKFVAPDGQTLDVALPRTERSTGPKHRDFSVQADPDLPVETDLGRRDFTINAMAQKVVSEKGTLDRLIDPFGGKLDLERRLLRRVFDKTFEEDPLRILRGVQFAARFELKVEPATFEAMKAAVPRLKDVSPERVIVELGKLLAADKPSRGFYLLRDLSALETLFPEIAAMSGVEQPKQFHVADVFDHTMIALDAAASDPMIQHRKDPELMLAVLYHDVGKPVRVGRHSEDGRITFYGHEGVSEELAKERLRHWKSAMIGAEPERVARLCKRHMFDTRQGMSDRALRRLIRSVGTDLIEKLLDLRVADRRAQQNPEALDDVVELRRRVEEELTRKPPLGVRDLAVSGNDLMAAGYAPGPAIGAELERLLELVLDDPACNTRNYLLSQLKAPVK